METRSKTKKNETNKEKDKPDESKTVENEINEESLKKQSKTPRMSATERKRKSRESLSKESRELELEKANERMRKNRNSETEEEREKRLNKLQIDNQIKREDRTGEQIIEDRNKATSCMKEFRASKKSDGNKFFKEAENWKNVKLYRLGKMDKKCSNETCLAYHFSEEHIERTPDNSYNDCCNHGKLKFKNSFKKYPEEWSKLFTGY